MDVDQVGEAGTRVRAEVFDAFDALLETRTGDPVSPPAAFGRAGEASAALRPIDGLEPRVTSAPRSTTGLGSVSVVLAVVVAPIGLVLSIVTAALSARRTGYVSALAKTGIALSIVFCALLVVGAAVGSAALQKQAAHDATRAQSVAMCTDLARKPGVLDDAAFGWPALGSTIPQYVSEVTAYETWWADVARSAPKTIRPEAAKVATAAQSVLARITASRVVDHDRDVSELSAVASDSKLPTWVASYCAN